MCKYILLNIILIFSYTGAISQTQLVLERVEGLSSNDKIEDIEVENDRVWIASKDGVFVFDNETNTLSQITEHDNALAVKVSKKGNIFSAYNDKTLFYDEDNLIDIETNFKKFKGLNFEFSDIAIYNRELWVGSNKGIFVFSLKTKKLLKHYTTENSSLKSNDIKFIIYSNNNERLWVGTANGAFEIKERLKKWKYEYRGHQMVAATENHEGLWLLSDLELYLMIKGREHPQGLKKGLFEGQVNDLALDSQNHLYVASDILTKFDPYLDKLEKFGENLGLAASKCISLASDNKGALWLGTADAGLYRIYSDSLDVEDMRVSLFLSNAISCPDQADASINVSVAGGTPPYKYLWERARLKGLDNPDGLKAGTYKVTVVDDMGSKSNSSLTIRDPKPIGISVMKTEPVTGINKKNGYCMISPSGGSTPYTINWENGEKGPEARKLEYGTNALIITDNNGCTKAESVTIAKPRILPDLNIATIKVGQTLQLNQLYFQADSSAMTDASYDVLDEVHEFLDTNPSVYIEIGGHTNNIPPHEYCDKLSQERAQTVSEFLYKKGINESRIAYKGYGKRNPIASNENVQGRRKNQRVEIKILRLD